MFNDTPGGAPSPAVPAPARLRLRVRGDGESPRGWSVVDADTGRPLAVRSLDLHADCDSAPTLTVEVVLDFDAEFVAEAVLHAAPDCDPNRTITDTP